MITHDRYQLQDFHELIYDYVTKVKKPFVFMRMVGPNKCNDVDKLNEVYALYKQILPTDIYHGIFYNEFLFVTFDKIEEALDFAEDHFPINQTEGDPDYYIHVTVYTETGEGIYGN